MKVKGLAQLLRFQKKLAELPRESRRAQEAIMRDWLERARRGFQSETDPYGRRWKKRKQPLGRPVLTGPTKRLRKLKLVRLTGHRWKIASAGKDYLQFHQKGTSRLPRRRVFPDDGRLPREWRQAAEKIYRKRLKDYFG